MDDDDEVLGIFAAHVIFAMYRPLIKMQLCKSHI